MPAGARGGGPPSAVGGPTAAELRRQAAHILAGYRPTDRTPRPLAGVLHAIGRALQVVFGPIGRFLRRVALHPVDVGLHAVFGAWWAVAAAVLAMAIGGAGAVVVVIRRRGRAQSSGRAGPGRAEPGSEDPDRLEADAAAAEAAGGYDAAVRLRFRAGLARLEAAGLVTDRQVRTDRQLARLLVSPSFDALAAQHEAIAYGGRPATGTDVVEAKRRWPSVGDEVRLAAAGARAVPAPGAGDPPTGDGR